MSSLALEMPSAERAAARRLATLTGEQLDDALQAPFVEMAAARSGGQTRLTSTQLEEASRAPFEPTQGIFDRLVMEPVGVCFDTAENSTARVSLTHIITEAESGTSLSLSIGVEYCLDSIYFIVVMDGWQRRLAAIYARFLTAADRQSALMGSA